MREIKQKAERKEEEKNSPQTPSSTNADASARLSWPRLAQKKVPEGQADVPGSSLPSGQSQKSSLTRENDGSTAEPSRHGHDPSGLGA